MNKYQLTAEDWIILRLLYVGVRGSDRTFAHSQTFMRTSTYMIDKLGKQAFYDAVDELHEERRQQEARAAQPRSACPNCGSTTQCR